MRAGATMSSQVPTLRNSGNASRAALNRAAMTGADITGMVGDYRICRDTYFQCMDEFCANKNAQLKRCACSSRMHEFAGMQKQMDNFSDKMLDFNEKLLTVSMDKEDADAILKATEGEDAYLGTKDKSSSQKILDTIMEKINKTSTDESMERGLTALNLVMDFTDPFDVVDMMLGSDTAAKEGDALYRAAMPTCREMAAEACGAEDVRTIQSAYQMAIEQDCNTIARTFAGMQDKAREKVFEAGALLDISRLNNYQTRNADDILACKRKMLDMMTDSAVCGADLGKCLDWSGKYIDPATGAPILTANLSNLAGMIKRPEGAATWANMPGNERFVSFLNAKKKYLEPAMANCEEVSAQAWTVFVEDALAQIRLAQGKKLEEMRQACTGVTTQCITGNVQSFLDFDARAMSIFGVHTDKSANAICAELQSACIALMKGTAETAGEQEAAGNWEEGMSKIATRKTYDQIIQTCTQVGQNCIVQNCNNLSGKFGLCTDLENSRQRKNIINRSLCWPEVLRCVQNAGKPDDTTKIGVIPRILTDLGLFGKIVGNDMTEYFRGVESNSHVMYVKYLSTGITAPGAPPVGTPYPGPPPIPPDDNKPVPDDTIFLNCPDADEYDACRIAERIWGNCTKDPSPSTSALKKDTGIIIEEGFHYPDTLLAWFAKNTNSTNPNQTSPTKFNCWGLECPQGQIATDSGCVEPENRTSDGTPCPLESQQQFNIGGGWTNCCIGGKFDSFGNCCESTFVRYFPFSTANITVSNPGASTILSSPYLLDTTPPPSIQGNVVCAKDATEKITFVGWYKVGDEAEYLFCAGTVTINPSPVPPDSGVQCNGKFFVISAKTGLYSMPIAGNYTGVAGGMAFLAYYNSFSEYRCEANFNQLANSWNYKSGTDITKCDKWSTPIKPTTQKAFIYRAP